ncbi:MAG TPA: CvpA family protein [Verrucomicrobiae bacterium]|jgi:hypothetical protein
MVWIIALVCLGLVGIIGYYQGPILGAFTFLGLVFGSVLAGLLGTLTKHLLPLLGLVHPIWGIFMPQAIAFVVVLIIFMVGGQVLHQKTAFYFKYKAKDKERISWERMYSRLGFCVGLLNGAVCFILLLIPIYAAGYFATEAQVDENDPQMPRFLSLTRAEILKTGMARVVGAYDPTPPQLYKAADIAALILHNPLLESRLCHYPPLMELGEVPLFDVLRDDLPFQNLLQTQAKVRDIITYPKVQAVLTNAALVSQVSTLIAGDLDDLQGFLMTEQSAKYDPETILGIWTADRAATMMELRQRQTGLTPLQMRDKEQDVFPILQGLSLTATPNGQMLLKKLTPSTPNNDVISAGNWKQESAGYQVTLPGLHPETSDVKIEAGNRLLLPKDGYVLVFDKEM